MPDIAEALIDKLPVRRSASKELPYGMQDEEWKASGDCPTQLVAMGSAATRRIASFLAASSHSLGRTATPYDQSCHGRARYWARARPPKQWRQKTPCTNIETGSPTGVRPLGNLI